MLALVLLFAAPVSAQTIFVPGGTIGTSSNGNVGIGTSSPSEKFVVGTDLGDVASDMGIVVGAPDYAQVVLGEDGNNRSMLSWIGDTNLFSIGTIDSGSGYFQTLTLKQGKVGIGTGTSTPQAKLQIMGDLYVSPSSGTDLIRAYGPGASGSGIRITDESSYIYLRPYHPMAGDKPMQFGPGVGGLRIDTNGNIGIGTTTPGALLDVSSGSQSGAVMIGADVNSTVRTSNATKIGRIVGQHYSFAEESVDLLRYSSSATTNEINIGGGANALNGATSIFFHTAPTTTTTSADARMVIDPGGNVGIGTTSPDAKLHISSNATYSSDAGRTLKVANASTPAKVIGFGYDSAIDAGFIQSTHEGVGTRSLLLNPSGGNVGIGTTIPGNLLHLKGSGQIQKWQGANDTSFVYTQFQTSENTALGYVGVEGSTAGAVFANSLPYATFLVSGASGRALQLGTAGAARMTVDHVGNVGIGTTSPSYKLHVAGTTALANAGAPNSGTYTLVGTYANARGLIEVKHDTTTNTADGLDIAKWGGTQLARFATSGSYILGGNVGIGTTGPSYKLDVTGPNTQIRFGSSVADSGGYLVSTNAGQGYLVGGAAWNGANWIAKNNASAAVQMTNDGTMRFYTNGGLTPGSAFAQSERMIINDTGNVGIGTTNPTSLLEVGGSGTTTQKITATNGAAQLELNGGGNYGQIANTAGSFFLTNSSATGPIIFRSGSSTERMRLTSAGDIGIGTTSPSAKLDVAGDAKISGNLTVNGAFSAPNYTATNGSLTGSSSSGLTLSAGGADKNITLATTGGGLVNVNGNLRVDGNFNQAFYTGEKTLEVQFANGAPNQKAQIYFNLQPSAQVFWGNLEIEITSGYAYQNSVGSLKKVFSVGLNPQGGSGPYSPAIYDNTSYYSEAAGVVADNWAIDGIFHDATSGRYYFTIIHRTPTGNNACVKIRGFGASATLANNVSALTAGPVYTTDATVYHKPVVEHRSLRVGYPSSQNLNQPDSSLVVNGNVGIGTNAPATKLHVAGTDDPELRIETGDDDRAVLSFNTGATRIWDFIANPEQNTSDKFTLRAGGSSDVMTWMNSGNVGIGTSAPDSKLVVNDNGNRIALGASSAGSSNLRLFRSGDISYLQDASGPSMVFRTWDGTQNHDLSYVNGNLGVGVGAPNGVLSTKSGLLTVGQGAGDRTEIRGGAGYGSQASFYYGGNVAVKIDAGGGGGTSYFNSGNVGVGTPAPSTKLHVVGGALRVDKGSTGASGIFTGGNSNLHIVHDSGADVRFQNSSGGGYRFTNSNNTGDLVSVTGSGNVGIGTPSPAHRLSVVGTTLLDAGVPNQPALILNGDQSAILHQNSAASGRWLSGLRSDNGGETDNFVFWNQTAGFMAAFTQSGRFGVGTMAPNTRLHVAAGGMPATFDNTAGAGLNGLIDAKRGGVTKYYLGFDGSDNFAILNNVANASLLSITNDGRVGIGTTTPGAKLHVEGNALITGGSQTNGQAAVTASAGQSDQPQFVVRNGQNSGGQVAGVALNTGDGNQTWMRRVQGGAALELVEKNGAGSPAVLHKFTTDSLYPGNGPGYLKGTTAGLSLMGANIGLGAAPSTSWPLLFGAAPLIQVSSNDIASGRQPTIAYPQGQSGSLRFKMSWYASGWGAEIRNEDVAGGGGNLVFMTTAAVGDTNRIPERRMTIAANGNVGIGTAATNEAKLSVEGLIRAREVVVDPASIVWADYVFDENYRNAPLEEVEAHIKEHKHLPGVPSAKEVSEKGISLGQMQATMLAKLEELTLHLIELKKENQELRREVETLKRSSTAANVGNGGAL